MSIKRILPMLASLLLLTTANVAFAEAAQTLPAPIQALQDKGIQVVGPFNAPGGLTGYAGFANQRPIAMYLTADGKHVIVGSMLNAKGEIENRDTVEKMVAEPMTQLIWSQLKKSTWIADGKTDAPHIMYEFSDPNCPYCHVFWKRIRPWVENGKVQVRHVLVGIISNSSPNKAATILTADDEAQAFAKNQHQFNHGGVTPMKNVPLKVRSKLVSNLMLMRKLGLRGTPGIVYLDDDGHVQFWRGVPKVQEITRVLGES